MAGVCGPASRSTTACAGRASSRSIRSQVLFDRNGGGCLGRLRCREPVQARNAAGQAAAIHAVRRQAPPAYKVRLDRLRAECRIRVATGSRGWGRRLLGNAEDTVVRAGIRCRTTGSGCPTTRVSSAPTRRDAHGQPHSKLGNLGHVAAALPRDEPARPGAFPRGRHFRSPAS